MHKYNIAFIHDHHFEVTNRGVFTTGSLNGDIWKRYYRENKHHNIHIIAREKKAISEPNEYNLSSSDITIFKLYEGYENPLNFIAKRKLIKEDIYNYFTDNNIKKVIVRLPSELGLIAISVANELKIPHAIEVVACTWDSYWNHGSIKAKLYAPIITYRVKKAIKLSQQAIYVTDNILQGRYPCNGKTSNASNVNLVNFDNTVITRRNFDTKRKSFNIVLVGTMKTNVKGIDVAIKAIDLAIKSSDYKFKLTVIGGGSPDKYKNIASSLGLDDAIDFKGFLSKDELYRFLDASDIYFQPSFQEGLPRATIEAMSRGLPVLASSAGGLPELINNKYIHKPGDHKKLAYDLLGLISNDDFQPEGESNFKRSKDFLPSKLEEKRSGFWESFI
ncbi:hypothetical protein OAW_01840 [Vibrio cyclitrophicus ZF170]|uniref:glycosyltransferase n=1 Tax=Vibrio cyclitrophicus TaxID=47951 RepID=UPI0002DE16A3|nr:glycosyltransferase [Vibrio cyclitrophicus]OBT04365.1 hypothetical protein A9265_17445 [Vibrio cyclitrophicus]OEE23119.1 hypothetical protein OAW_01840 [Vibrio cyclitrophicus ZF170]